jgi:hypothetical protein
VSRRSRLAAATAALAVGACVTFGCDDLERFSNEPGEAYCGAITLGSSFRMGLSPRVQMRLYLDASLLDGPGSPGTVSTYEAAVDEQPERRLLKDAELRPMSAMAHDPLSRLEFGDGRERNAIFAVSPVDPEAESMLAIVSLRADGRAEVRLVRAGVKNGDDGTPPAEGRRAIFGIFTLSKQKGACGF